MFTPRQLLGHLYLIEGLNELKPKMGCLTQKVDVNTQKI